MDEWARHSDLTLKSMIGMTYNPFTKTYKLESDQYQRLERYLWQNLRQGFFDNLLLNPTQVSVVWQLLVLNHQSLQCAR
jgi:2-polyprenyl-3-methyl-5-hydroxy-6-metoxy-1,4-benzoquinol methylase